MVDAIERVQSILFANWEIANTTNRKPMIKDIDEVKNPQVTSNIEYVLLHETTNTDEYPGLNLEFKDQNWTITCEVRAGTKKQMKRIDEETVRILDLFKTNVGEGFSYWETSGRRILVKDKNKPLYILARDVRVYKQSVTC